MFYPLSRLRRQLPQSGSQGRTDCHVGRWPPHNDILLSGACAGTTPSGTQWCIDTRPAGHASSAATRRPTVNKFVEFCFQFCYWLFKTTKYSKGKKGCGSREPPPFELRRILFSTSLLSKPQAKPPDGSPIGGFFRIFCRIVWCRLDFSSPRCIIKLDKGNSEQIVCGWVADLLPPVCGLKNGKYIQYSSIFQTLSENKISRYQLLPIYSELP